MKRAERQRLALVRQVYARIPPFTCKGLCADACTAIPMSTIEYARLTELAGAPPGLTDEGRCSLLVGGRCSQYRDRPLICRLYGASEGLPCPHGCAPAVPLTDEQGAGLLADVEQHGGPVTGPPEVMAMFEAARAAQ